MKIKSRKQLAISLYISAIKNGFGIEEAIAHASEVMAYPLDTGEQAEAEGAVRDMLNEFTIETQEDI